MDDATLLPEPPPEGWGLDPFLEVAAAQLSELGLTGAAPDRRTVRYYATAGLLDRPESHGREVRYRQRQLAQLLAVKRLQAAGVRLAAIAERIAGVSTDQLARLAHTAQSLETGPAEFWRQHPADAAPPAAPAAPPPVEPGSVQRPSVLTLAPGVRLVLDADLSPTEAGALTRAAAPLLTRIAALGLGADTTKAPGAGADTTKAPGAGADTTKE
ncbi:hypothetical protein CGZ98_12010 [Enemella evansiae]|uniref:helix-turn-helix domain-containing protein n=1 Tax=Enemella evansiae TaxID=2016499 RepID=UPI000B9620D6|nr:MerR family transcriptional regulator [Enemella evansiae]OYO09847.1 hypothetical protein CGZ98_12010 [Enemella evansiae]